jgi:hypothetical protein
MSFAVWQARPPFPESDLTAGERIYRVNDKWVITDQGEPTQQQIDAVLNAPVQKSQLELCVEYIASKVDAPLGLKEK